MDREDGRDMVPSKHYPSYMGPGNRRIGQMDTDRSSPINKGSLVSRTRIIIKGTKGSNRMNTMYNMKTEDFRHRGGNQIEIDRSSPISRDSSRSLARRTKTISKGTKGSNRTGKIYNRNMVVDTRIFK